MTNQHIQRSSILDTFSRMVVHPSEWSAEQWRSIAARLETLAGQPGQMAGSVQQALGRADDARGHLARAAIREARPGAQVTG